MMKVLDISQEVFSCCVYPGDPAPQKQTLVSMEAGEAYNLSAFSMCAHNGTHVDVPRHFIREGRTVDETPLEAFAGPCYVARCAGALDARGAREILQRAQGIGRILLSGDVTVTETAAREFAGAKLMLLGNESQSVGPADAPVAVHRILLGAGVALLEGIRLRGIPEGAYLLCAAPLNLGGCEGAPCRAVLFAKEEG